MNVLAIDPGNEQSAWLIYDGTRPLSFGQCGNFDMYCRATAGTDIGEGESDFWRSMHWTTVSHVAIETLHVRGMPTAQEEMDTQFEAGRIISRIGLPFTKMRRMDIKLHLCGSARAKDGNVRQALLDRWGGKARAVGKKANQGPLYGIGNDVWSALAVAVTWWDTQRKAAT